MEYFIKLIGASLVVQRVKMGSIPGSGRSPGGGHGNLNLYPLHWKGSLNYWTTREVPDMFFVMMG